MDFSLDDEEASEYLEKQLKHMLGDKYEKATHTQGLKYHLQMFKINLILGGKSLH